MRLGYALRLATSIAGLAAVTMAPSAHADDAVVGNGSPGSCTELALIDALFQVYFGGTQGGRISFDCGAAPLTIPLTATILLDAGVRTEIDGAGLITLDAGNQRRHFTLTGNATVVTLRGLTLRSGSATDFGGAVYLASGASLLMDGCRLFNNGAGTAGGAIAGESGSILTVARSRFDANSASSGGAIAKTGQLAVDLSDFDGNSATDQGGAIQWWFGNGAIRSSTFTGNTGGNGGAILLRGGDTRIETTRIDNNLAGDRGGGLYAYEDARLTIDDVELVNNQAGRGGGLYLDGVQDVNVDPNNVIPTTVSTRALVKDSLIAANRSTGGGGGVTVFGPLFQGRFAALELENTEVSDNVAGGNGGGILSAGRVDLRNARILRNTAEPIQGVFGSGDGGGLYLVDFTNSNGEQTLVQDSVIRGNIASDTGGGIDASTNSLVFQGATLSDNVAQRGGGLYLFITSPFAIERATFARNRATREGGGLYLFQRAPGRLTQLTFADNRVDASGAPGRDILMRSDTDNSGNEHEATLTHITALNTLGLGGTGLLVSGNRGFRLRNSIVLGNVIDCAGPATSEGGNVFGGSSCGNHAADTQLASLQVLGPGQWVENEALSYYLPAAASPAVDSATCVAGVTTDQRRLPINRDGNGDGFLRCDAGAIERQSASEQAPAAGPGLPFRDGFES